MKFQKDRYTVIKKAVSKELSNFFENYFLIKRQCAKTLFDTKQISPYSVDYGYWTDPQVPNTYSCYADMAMETLLLKLRPTVEKTRKTGGAVFKLLIFYYVLDVYTH